MASRIESEEHLVFLDACCLINLFATGRAEEILETLPYRFAVARYVAEEEVLEIATQDEAAGSEADETRVALHPLIAALADHGALALIDVSSREEQRQLVHHALDLDDGEAHTCALAVVRGATVATDDRKAIRILRPHPCIRTSELLFEWSEAQRIAEADLAQILHAIARRASFLPPKDDPHFKRWVELLEAQSPGPSP